MASKHIDCRNWARIGQIYFNVGKYGAKRVERYVVDFVNESACWIKSTRTGEVMMISSEPDWGNKSLFGKNSGNIAHRYSDELERTWDKSPLEQTVEDLCKAVGWKLTNRNIKELTYQQLEILKGLLDSL